LDRLRERDHEGSERHWRYGKGMGAGQTAFSDMPGLVPANHAAPLPANPKAFRRLDDVDDRDKPGHDGVGFSS
jgi:hypothetical protein